MNQLPSIDAKRAPFAERLLAWFADHRRDFPWRRTDDPYRIWVSEVMLQQTRAATVVPYFERFVERFPDLPALADADMDDVLKAWEGLGYYRRARHLKAAAEHVVRDGGQALPEDYDAMLALPGVGRYTAGAVMCLAHDHPRPILDGNVRRVLSRVWAIDADQKTAATTRWLWSAAEGLLPSDRPGAFNEAMMELGATVCTPRRPRCGDCPLASLCDGYADGAPADYPVRPPKKTIPHVDVTAAVIRRGSKILITQRRAEAMLGGLWEFPGGKLEPGETLEECLLREIREELDIAVRIEGPLVAVDHAYSHFRITLHTYLCRHSRGRVKDLGCAAHRWVTVDQLRDFAFPKADRVVLARLEELG
ncbi:MAG: A/G-specific adenine glycosylase [Myxococcota bacterium]|nr:A/G-specific adenine glycosylase [Myxococcota bacterium]